MVTIPVGKYLWERIKEVGVKTVMGVPGDFNLQFLDYIYQVEGLRFVGNANELNAAYAADGYSRVKGVPGCFVTTHGVGELSALNGVAGSYSEQVKTIHVVGQTTRNMQDSRMLIHHSISNDPDHTVYSKMSEPARVAAAHLQDAKTAPAEIDRVIRECFIQQRPVYVFLPLDLSWEEVPVSLLDKKLDLSPPIDKSAQDAAVSAIAEALQGAKSPCIFIDALVHRHDAIEEARKLVDKLQVPVYCANMGKTLINDDHPCFVGLYNGVISSPGIEEAFQNQDLAIVLGTIPCDTNTGGFTRKVDKAKSVDVQPFEVTVKGKFHKNIYLKPLLAQLLSTLKPVNATIPKVPAKIQPRDVPSDRITQKSAWGTIVNFFQPGDVILGDTGTCTFGMAEHAFAPSTFFTTQTYYGSIGWATPATLGSSLAVQDGNTRGHKRTILVTGDGSFGLTMQEVGTMIKYKTNPIIFIINNSGYTIERVIHGAQQPYNDVNTLDYSKLLPLFSHPEAEKAYLKATTPKELEDVLQNKLPKGPPDYPIVVEVVMDKLDVPWRLSAQMALRGPAIVKELRDEGFSGWEDGKVPEEWVDAEKTLKGPGRNYMTETKTKVPEGDQAPVGING